MFLGVCVLCLNIICWDHFRSGSSFVQFEIVELAAFLIFSGVFRCAFFENIGYLDFCFCFCGVGFVFRDLLGGFCGCEYGIFVFDE